MRIEIYNSTSIQKNKHFSQLPDSYRRLFSLYSQVLEFRSNNYVVNELVNWDDPFNDPVFHINFFPTDSLSEEHLDLLKNNGSKEIVRKIQNELNPDPDNNSFDIPLLNGKIIDGVQHKFSNVCIVFPKKGQQCHAYCNFCFRWAQFINNTGEIVQYNTSSDFSYLDYIQENKQIEDVLFTGGDPMFMSTKSIKEYIEPLLSNKFDHVKTIRIGTKSLGFWPYRFISDPDSDELLRFFESINKKGKHFAFMAHFNHWRELETEAVKTAIKNIQSTGAVIRTQSPLLKNINDDPKVWIKMWNQQVKLGCVPYYMFVERITGASNAYKVPLHRAWEIFRDAYQESNGLARTVRGPLMSSYHGKVMINGVTSLKDEKYFVLSFLRSRSNSHSRIPFLAKYNETATWITDLSPAYGEKFYFEN